MEATGLRTAAITALAPIAWGSTYFVTKTWLPAEIPLTGAVLRALPAGLLLLAITRQLPRGEWWWRTAVISTLTIGGFFALIYVAAMRLPSGFAATLMATSAIVTLLLARVLLGERASLRKYSGAVIGVAGVGLLVGGASGRLDPLGIGALLLAMFSGCLGYVLTKRWQPPVSPMTFAGWQLTLAGVLLAPVAFAVEGAPPAFTVSGVLAFAYIIVIATALAYAVWFHGLKHLSAGTVGLIGLLNPLAGAVLGAVAAGERFTLVQLAGAVAILAGVAAGVERRPSAKSLAQPAGS